MSEFGSVLDLAVPGVRGLTPYAPGKPLAELERDLGIRGAVKLASNENPLGPSPRALEAVTAALGELARYPDGGGYYLKTRLAAHLGVGRDRITLGNGSNDVLELLARTFAGPGDEVVFSAHAFVVYALAAQAVGARGVAVPAREWGHDLEAMAAAVTPATRLVFIANPNNPTGTWVDRDALEGFLAGLPAPVVAVVDEAYFEYVAEAGYPNALEWLERFPRLVVTRTFSKAYGLAGLRVGYGVSHPEVADLLNRVRQPFNVNSLALAAAEAALGDPEHLRRGVELNRREMARVTGTLAQRGIPFIPSVGNFVAVDVGRPAGPVYEALLREGVIVRPVAGYGMPHHLRVSLGLPEENDRFLAALGRVLEAGA